MTDLVEHLMDATDDELRAEILRRLDAPKPVGEVVAVESELDGTDGLFITVEVDHEDVDRLPIALGDTVKLVRVYEDRC